MELSWQDLIRFNLILLFDLYLLITFLAGFLLSYHKYRLILGLIRKVPGRWPRLYEYVRQQRALVLNRWTLIPLLGGLAILVIHTGLYRLVWHAAQVTPERLTHSWAAFVLVGVTGLLMLGFDLYTMFRFQPLELARVESDLDRAEYWFTSWVGKAVHVVTLGTVNPQNMVKKEVRKAILGGLRSLDRAVWLWIVQISFRLLFGFSLWYSWARLLGDTAP